MSKNKNTYPEIHRKYIYIQQIGIGVFLALAIISMLFTSISDIAMFTFAAAIISAVIFNISLYFYYIYYFKKVLKAELPFWLVPDQSIVIHDMINKDQKKI